MALAWLVFVVLAARGWWRWREEGAADADVEAEAAATEAEGSVKEAAEVGADAGGGAGELRESNGKRRSGERRGRCDGDWSKGGCEVKDEVKSLRLKPKALAARTLTLTFAAAESSCSQSFGWSSWLR